MSICLCYHDEQNFLHERGVCYGTKEKEPCSCGGNPVKCDFYEEVREKYIHRTNYDCLISKTPEELAEWVDRIRMYCANDLCGRGCPLEEICYSRADAPTKTLDWLKEEA
jgi:hypothetical protein